MKKVEISTAGDFLYVCISVSARGTSVNSQRGRIGARIVVPFSKRNVNSDTEIESKK